MKLKVVRIAGLDNTKLRLNQSATAMKCEKVHMDTHKRQTIKAEDECRRAQLLPQSNIQPEHANKFRMCSYLAQPH